MDKEEFTKHLTDWLYSFSFNYNSKELMYKRILKYLSDRQITIHKPMSDEEFKEDKYA